MTTGNITDVVSSPGQMTFPAPPYNISISLRVNPFIMVITFFLLPLFAVTSFADYVIPHAMSQNCHKADTELN